MTSRGKRMIQLTFMAENSSAEKVTNINKHGKRNLTYIYRYMYSINTYATNIFILICLWFSEREVNEQQILSSVNNSGEDEFHIDFFSDDSLKDPNYDPSASEDSHKEDLLNCNIHDNGTYTYIY